MIVLAMLAGLVVVAGVYELEEGETPLAAWKRKVAAAVQRYVDREGKAVNAVVGATDNKARGLRQATRANERRTLWEEYRPPTR